MPKWFWFCSQLQSFLRFCQLFGKQNILSHFRFDCFFTRLVSYQSQIQNLFLIWFKFVTMIGMWIIPFLISVKYDHIRFVIIWFFFTAITILIAIRATRSPIERTTPRLFYKWFLLVHKVSYILGIVGYVGLMLTFLGFNFLFFVSPTVIIFNTFFFSKKNLYFYSC